MIQEQISDGSLAEPICTFVHQSPAAVVKIMEFSLSAATSVAFRGARYLHGWMSHNFFPTDSSRLTLVAQARQFSSFIVLIGRIASNKVFDPKFAMIAQNKDDIKILSI